MTKFSEIAHHYLGTGLQATYTDTFGETVVGTLDGVDTRYQRVHVDGCITYNCMPHLRSLHKLTQPIRVEGEEPFVPIERLYDLCMEEPFSRMPHTNQTFVNGLKERCYEIELDGGMGWFRYNEAKQFFSRYGAQDFVYNQFALFQQLLSWHFNLFSVPEGEFIEIEETTNTPEAGEK